MAWIVGATLFVSRNSAYRREVRLAGEPDWHSLLCVRRGVRSRDGSNLSQEVELLVPWFRVTGSGFTKKLRKREE
jgi:hypothetical protein